MKFLSYTKNWKGPVDLDLLVRIFLQSSVYCGHVFSELQSKQPNVTVVELEHVRLLSGCFPVVKHKPPGVRVPQFADCLGSVDHVSWQDLASSQKVDETAFAGSSFTCREESAIAVETVTDFRQLMVYII